MNIENYTCPDCNATHTAKAVDCCDTCILKFFAGDVNELALTNEIVLIKETFEYERPEGMSDSSWEALCDALALYAEEWEND